MDEIKASCDSQSDEQEILAIGHEQIKSGPILHKRSRAGGPVTCVSLRTIPNKEATTITPTLVRIWGLGPYLFRSCGDDQREMLVFPETIGGSIHGVSFRQELDSHGQKSPEVHELPVLPGDEYDWDAAVFGGRHLAFCRILRQSELERLDIYHNGIQKPLLAVADWIWDVKLLPGQAKGGNSMVALGLGRHSVELWNVLSKDMGENMNTQSLHLNCHRRIPGFPSCLVMSMNIFQSDDHLLVAAGTAFQVIQVWSLAMHDDCSTAASESHRLEGHAGVIHAVKFSPDGRYIASTSDDRSVRLWALCEESAGWKAEWVGWGHTARVWSVGFAGQVVASVAEDATTRLWSLNSGTLLSCIKHLTSLWSIAIWNDTAMVGATDGTVSVYNLPQHIQVIEEIEIPDDRPPMSTEFTSTTSIAYAEKESAIKETKSMRKLPAQVIVGLQWMGMNRILVANRSGSLIAWSLFSRQWEEYEPWWESTGSLFHDHRISATDGCCMTVVGDWVAIGTTSGDGVLLRLIPKSQEQVIHRTVLSAKTLKAIQGFHHVPEKSILFSFHVRSVALWSLDGMQNLSPQAMLTPTTTLTIETKGVPISCAFDANRRQLLVGDTRGNIALFEVPSLDSQENHPPVKASSVILRVHRKEHVTSICLLGDRVLSSGNDGSIHTSYRIGTSLQKGISVPIPAMTGISRVWFEKNSQQNSERFVAAGFFGNTFRVVDVYAGYELFRMDTGGRQRILDLFSQPNCKQLVVCANQKHGSGSISIQRGSFAQETPGACSPLGEGIAVHGETIFDACFFSLGSNENTCFLLTGSEDCTSKVYLCDKNRIMDYYLLTPQESCVRAVCASQVDKTSALLVVGGGKLVLQFFVVKLTCKSRTSVTSLNDVTFSLIGTGHNRQKASIDHRINSVKAVPLGGVERTHVVLAGDSAGQCHLYLVSENGAIRPLPGIMVLCSSRPILSLAMIPLHDRILFAMGTTAGDVILYNLLPRSEQQLRDDWQDLQAKPWVPLMKSQVHQMGTNAMSHSICEPSPTKAQVTIVTGGDDQSVSVCRIDLDFSFNNLFSFVEVVKTSITTAHAASFSAIKGVSHVSHPTTFYFLTAGYTQQMALWKFVEECGCESSIEIVQHMPVDVGDVNVLATFHQTTKLMAVVAGIGLEFLSLENI